ncbi:hypothetical protein QCA50_008969 [Cerrena zonata]|uniref:Uncharacterized protein n=1 Tax=Cerrena zonata TaxID=2478898 RepID=A0AAW0GDP9_9APHY
MPPQPGVFAISHPVAGPSRIHGTPVEDPKRKRKDFVGRLDKELKNDIYYSGKHYQEEIMELNKLSYGLAIRPEAVPAYQLRLYPVSLERSALLASLIYQEKYSLDNIQTAYEEEREKVEEEWKKGRDRIRERLLEGIEERKRRAREEKDGEGTVGDGALDSQSRPHITRKLRNKLGGTSPPPTPLSSTTPGVNGGITSIASGPITSGPFLNPHSLSVDELPSPFPLPLTSTHANSSNSGTGSNSRRRPKGGGRDNQQGGVLGKSMTFLGSAKEAEIESDLVEIRRGNKRRRAAANATLNKG